ncbi:hypothetical protein NM688_g3687 [Phlebia brevispora]|uniref:Uncharacterized protein n=1 Tax=Phlebia brevispora TaxID=194682 RepID=A0ACC1T542_9APHY|nr:hypothetical protein NM688_g3687 [Phlebia brevispora]
MPPKRQASTRAATNKPAAESKRTTATRIPTRKASHTRTKPAAEAIQGEADELANDLNERLTIADKGKRRGHTAARVTRPAARKEEEFRSLTQDDGTAGKERGEASSKPEIARRPRNQSNLRARDVSESLVSELTTKLTLSPKSEEEQCLEAMRTVNAASRRLSNVIESGWTRSKDATSAATTVRKTSKAPSSVHTAASVTEYFATARHALQVLRKLKPSNLDVERAASSLFSKLITLEMYDCASEALGDAYNSVVALYYHDTGTILASTSNILRLLCLPFPQSPQDCNEVLLTLLSTHLLQALTILSYTLFNDTSDRSPDDLEGFCDALYKTNTLVSWIPHLQNLPPKHLDSILTRAYTALTKSSQLYDNAIHAAAKVYRIRAYGLLCLAHTSTGVLAPSTFWSQTVKFAASYVKDVNPHSHTSDEARDPENMSCVVETVSRTFTELIDCAGQRSDHEIFLAGRGFITFCEYWTSFAKRANDLHTLERIRGLMQKLDVDKVIVASDTPTTPTGLPQDATNRSRSQNGRGDGSGDTIESAQLYALFSEATTLLEQADSAHAREESCCLEETLGVMGRCTRYLQVSYASDSSRHSEEDERRHADKVKRSLERLRRAAVKVLEALPSSSQRSSQTSCRRLQVIAILKKGVDVLENVILTVSVPPSFQDSVTDVNAQVPHRDLLTATLDSLFALARATLQISNTSTFTEAYDYLSRSASLVPTDSQGEDVLSHANFIRCISGAYHNLAATLYHATRYDFAVRFLNRSCALGELALKMYRVAGVREGGHSSTEKSDDSWGQLEDQLWRRWEILGVCHSKTEDRKQAFQSFVNCVKAFPFHRYDFVELASKSDATSLFYSPQLKHLGGIVDRLTYGGLCDLYLEPNAVSLATHLKAVFVGHDTRHATQVQSTVLGALLERQLETLEGSKWKPDIRKAMDLFLSALLEIYEAIHMPIRRARVMLKILEMAYHTPENLGASPIDKLHIRDIAAQADKLLTTETLHWDEHLGRSQPYYHAMLKLWLALLAHHSAQTSLFSRVVSYADDACSILKSLASAEPRTSVAKESPPLARGGRKPSTKVQASTNRAVGRTRTRTVKAAPVAAPVTPRRKTSRSVAAHSHLATPVAKSDLERAPQGSEFDGMPQLVDLLRATAQLLGLLGQVITKVRLLLQARRICERLVQARPDDFVKISVDLAHEYVKLGKTEKGANVYKHTLNMVKGLPLSEETRVLYLLRYSESLAVTGNILKSSTAYCEASSLADSLPESEKGVSTVQRITARLSALERGAIAASTFANIQYSRDEPATSIDGLLQSLRLWNRALDTLSRLVPPPPKAKGSDESDNPFLTDEAKASINGKVDSHEEAPPPTKTLQRPPAVNGLEWRIAEGLLGILFALVQAYLARGSPREAEYFAQQAKELAESLDAPAMASRALARIGELQLHIGSLEESHASLTKAAALAAHTAGPDAAEIRRLLAEHSRRSADEKGAQQLYAEAMSTLEELDNLFVSLDGSSGPRKSLGAAPQMIQEAMAPETLIAILRQNIWLLHGEGEEYQSLLERFRAITANPESQAEQDALLAKLSLDNVYSRFQADMFLSSLTESTITMPMGKSQELASLTASRHEILDVLANAEKLFWSDLTLVARRGRVFHVRDAAVSLALIRAFQVSLGKTSIEGPLIAAGLLDSAMAITLRREMLEVVRYKFPDVDHDDLQWPLITSNGSPLPPRKSRGKLRFDVADSEDSDEDVFGEKSTKAYWDYVKKKYEAYACDAMRLSESQGSELPSNWTVVNISVTEDKHTMFVTRQRWKQEPLVVCIPLKGRRENEEEEQLSFDDAFAELQDIIRLSDEGTRQATHVRNDREWRAAWWADRIALDKRMKELLENIEFCWLGAFKAVLSSPRTVPVGLLAEFRTSLESIFERSIHLRDKRQKTFVQMEDSLVECFSSLSPQCRDEELEDVVYFILDLYQFHGVPVATAEVDVDQAVIDVRAALEEFSSKAQSSLVAEQDPHLFLILDKNVQGIPWESIPILRGRSVSRIPSMDFLLDRLEYARRQGAPTNSNGVVDRVMVDPRKVFYALNPSGDLKNTEGRFVDWLKGMKTVGWDGVTGRAPSEQQFADALSRRDLVLYFGHGGAEQYIRSRKVRHLPRCAATMLWGCSSGALKEMGDFDRTGTPHNYMLAGCPTLVANLWDVTDRDIDKFAQSVFDKMTLNADHVSCWQEHEAAGETSIVAALGQSRKACKLKYLTGAAPVIYVNPAVFQYFLDIFEDLRCRPASLA